ncbi:MAG: acylphosphatase [Patescibacteria group bacterium]
MYQALIKISGQVQGVFYRAHAHDEACALNLKGYVKNMPNQTVEALVQGEKNAIEKFTEWCRVGSPSSKVEKVEISWQTPGKPFTEFSSQ